MRFRSVLFLLAFAFAASSTSANAQAFPTRPITMIVVFSAGGPTDVMARIVAEHMSKTLGQQIIIENAAGAGGTIGGGRGARAEPDGYTLTVGSLGSHAAAARALQEHAIRCAQAGAGRLDRRHAWLSCGAQGISGQNLCGISGLM